MRTARERGHRTTRREVLSLVAPMAGAVVADAVLAARSGRGGPFAAVVVDTRTGEVVGRGTNTVTSRPDPTAHAEIGALREAALTTGRPHLDGLVLLSSCEPCPMCMAACLWAHLDAVLFVATRVDAAAAGFDDVRFDRVLGTPEHWPSDLAGMHVVHVPHPDARRPFQAWRDNPDTHPY